MPVALINDFVFLPHPADWNSEPEWVRTWQTGITASITGAEQRQSVRSLPRTKLSYVISALSLEERAELDERLDAASKSGTACVPYYGRGSVLQNDVVAETVNLSLSAWPWAVGDYAFFQSSYAQAAYHDFDVCLVTGVVGNVLTLDHPVSRLYLAGALVWPLLFGKFAMQKQNANSSWHGDVKITVDELEARGQVAVGNVPAPGGPGIGGWKVGSTLIVQ